VLHDLKKLKVKNWTYLVNDRKACYKLKEETNQQGVLVSAEEEEEDK
jgi:hypothetical protein